MYNRDVVLDEILSLTLLLIIIIINVYSNKNVILHKILSLQHYYRKRGLQYLNLIMNKFLHQFLKLTFLKVYKARSWYYILNPGGGYGEF